MIFPDFGLARATHCPVDILPSNRDGVTPDQPVRPRGSLARPERRRYTPPTQFATPPAATGTAAAPWGDGAVTPKRIGQDGEAVERSGEIAAFETMRSTANPSAAKPEEKTDDEKVSIFWRVFGGTILSIVALAAVTLYNNLSSGISDLRAELTRER